MTECGVCPQAMCLTTSAAPSSTSSSTSSSSNDTGAIVGGIVGGLVGLGIIIGIAVYCYFKRHKKLNGKLPFAFSSTNTVPRTVQQQEKQAPHPAVIAALAHQNDRLSQSYNKNISNRQSIHSLNDLNTTTINTPATQEDDEFEKRIALQNKRISEILLANPRLSSTGPPLPTSRVSSAYYTTDEESDMDDRKSVSTIESTAVVRTVTPQSSVAVVQVVRAKPQIMRVNSVKSNGGLSRNDSVRTVLTAVTPSENNLAIPQVKEEEDDEINEFPTTPNNQSFATAEDPFHDTHSINTTSEYFNNNNNTS